jgi:uncharacterized membrane protein YphA (DoxX/SURF4 family)
MHFSGPTGGEQRWSLTTRVAFRFSFIYLGLFIVLGWVLMFPLWLLFGRSHFGTFTIGAWGPFRGVVAWAGSHLFDVTASSGPISEPSPIFWVQLFCIFVVAVVGTAIWSAVDRKRQNYEALHAWFRIAVLMLLAAAMFSYGTNKLIPTQMWFPRLTRLLERFGDFSPMAVLWNSIGSSPAYERFTGCAEILGGLLLIIPRMTTLGALICLADLTNVFMLNMTYDVNVKAISLHLLLMSMFLLAPDAGRLANFFLDRPTSPSRRLNLFRSAHANRFVRFAQALLGIAFLAGAFELTLHTRRLDSFKPVLYGIWNVEDFSIDGQSRPPMLTDSMRWRRVVFQNVFPWLRWFDDTFHSGKFFQAEEMVTYDMKDEQKDYRIAFVSAPTRKIQMFNYPDLNKQSELLSLTQPAPGQLVLDGTMNGHRIHARLSHFDASKFYLVSHSGRLNWAGSGSYE